MAENYREQNQEEAEGIVDAGGFVNDPGTGMIAEDQETAAAAVEDVVPAQAPVQYDDEAAVAAAEASENVHIDLHEDTGSGLDWAVIVIILLVIIGCLSFAIAFAPTEEEQQIIAQQQALKAMLEGSDEPPYEVVELPAGVAAVVNDEIIEENTIDGYIARFRTMYGLEDDGDWAAWMLQTGNTPEKVRELGITNFVDGALIRQGIEKYGIEVSDEAVNEIYDPLRAKYATEEEWQRALAETGYTEESIREQCWRNAAEAALMEYLGDQWFPTPEDENAELLVAVKQYYPKYSEVESLEGIPEEELEPVRELVVYYAQQDAYAKYIEDVMESGGVKMSAAPSDLPYDTNLLLGMTQSIANQMAANQEEAAQQ